MKRVFTIPPGYPFLDRLAAGISAQAKNGNLADMLVLLPTRRAILHLREAFLRQSGAQGTLLPRMQPVGGIDEDGLFFAEERNLEFEIPPAIPPLRRQLLLTRLISAKDKNILPDQAAQLAAALAHFLDQTQANRRDFRDLAQLTPANLAGHWQQTLEFLRIVTEEWPKLLAAEGCVDPATRLNLLIEAQAEAWRQKPPAHPVIAAGLTGTIPATAELLDVIATLPQGAVVLPGLDCGLDEEAWQEVDESHPQNGMKEILKKFGLRRDEVKLWPSCAEKPSPRVRLLNEAMRPPKTTGEWRNLKQTDIPRAALEGIARLELDNAQEEAQAVALVMRAALEEQSKTAMLVTPSRDLAERVAAALARWGVEVNDSAGLPLRTQPVGGLLLDVLAAARKGAGPVEYLSLLKHPIAACGLDPAECRKKARDMEVLAWRAPGGEDGKKSKDIRRWFAGFKKSLAPLAQGWRKKKPLAEWLAAHIAVAEQTAASADEKGPERLWRGAAGEAAAGWLAALREAAYDFPPLNGESYAGLFAEFLRSEKVRPSFGLHPRLSILGVIEARLIHADLVILGGLNEDSWPPETGVDPWMSRPMKKTFGLPAPEERVGGAAHDFVQLASAPEVVLTRARRAGSAPAVPSRFLLQLETVLQALGYHGKDNDALAPAQPWAAWARMLDEPATIKPCEKPLPCPPVKARPDSLRVTEIGTWQRNPYAIYARRILNLEKLEPLEVEAGASERGIIIHEALEKFLTEFSAKLPPDALEELLRAGRESFAVYEDFPQVAAFWWPRFERAAAWFIEQESARRANGIKLVKAEAAGTLALGHFTLRGRADRIDKLPDGTLAIIDYKTGAVPSGKSIRKGLEPQLPLLALIAEAGGFKDIAKAKVAQLAYWKLGGEKNGAQPVKEDLGELVPAAREGLLALIARYADPKMPYRAMPRPAFMPRFDDYAHLARVAEWSAGENDEEAA